MGRMKDTRDFSLTAPPEAAESAAEALSDSLPGHVKISAGRLNATTGSAASIAVDGAAPEEGDLVALALSCVQDTFSSALGFDAVAAPEFVPDRHVLRTSGGKSVVHLQQQHHGIPVFDMTRSVHFGAQKNIERIVGDSLSLSSDVTAQPKLSAADALRVAAAYLAANQEPPEEDAWGQHYTDAPFVVPTPYAPRVVSSFERPTQPTVLDKGPFGREVPASLVYFHDGHRVHLSWKLALTMPDILQAYLMVVSAEHEAPPTSVSPGQAEELVLLCQPVTASATGNVFRHNPGRGAREFVDFPLATETYPVSGTPLPNPFPEAWWVETHFTLGNCAQAVAGLGMQMFQANVTVSSITFDPAGDVGADQTLLNAFFFCNFMHDFFYLLGFDEASGNFQRTNAAAAGAAGDPVLIRVHPGKVPGTANMATPMDGAPPLMNLGTVTLPDGQIRHTALDSDVVFHEYVHGVTNRLVGGRMNTGSLLQHQSRGMGEGWGDYFALTIQNHGVSPQNEKVVTGDWVTGNPGGIRSEPYTANFSRSFADVANIPSSQPHRIGEIWCAALMQMSRNLDGVLGAPAGHQLGWQIVVDGLKLAPANPSFLDGRNAIIAALKDRHEVGALSAVDHSAALRAVWEAFARFGMGAQARTNGASRFGIVADSTLPLTI